MNCKEANSLIHEYLDGELGEADQRQLRHHLSQCTDCRRHLRSLEKTDAFIRSLPRTRVPDGLTDRIMQQIPAQRKQSTWMRWIRRHPAASVAVVFIIVMLGSFASLWNQDQALILKGSDLDQLEISGKHVTVPADHTIHGSLTVENGTLEVDGEVEGNLTIMNGQLQLASTAHITGKITRINQAIDWLWYKVGNLFTSHAT